VARKKVIYIISPRSAYSWNPGRKISSIIALWSKKYELTTFFGGDLINPNVNKSVQYGNANIHKKSYNNYKILEPLVHTYSEIKDIIHNIKSYIFLSKKYHAENFSLVWERSSRLHFAGLLYAKKYNLPYVLEWKDNLINYKYSLLKPLALYFEDYKCKRADKIVVESYVLKDMLSNMGYAPEKIFVAHNAADSKVFKRNEIEGKTYRTKANIPLSSTVVGYLGSYAFYHNALLLVKAAKIIRDKNLNLPVTFLMVGDGLDYTKCKTFAEENSLKDDFIFFEPPVKKEEVPNILSAVDIAVLPGSTTIISPIKILEYMANGAAIVVPDYKCNSEIVNEDNGLLFKPNDEFDLAEKIIELLQNKELALNLSTNAICNATVKYSWENTWGLTLDNILDTTYENDK
jgi:glycosyltransferase involved in cell wall biosynthesis